MRKLIALALVAGCTGLFADGNTASVITEASVTIYAPVTLAQVGTFNLGKWVITNLAEPTSIPFENGKVGTGVNIAPLKGVNALAPSFPTFVVTKDAALGVSLKAESDTRSFIILPPSFDGTGSRETDTFKLNGHWDFAAGSKGVQTAKIIVTASYI